MTYLARAGLRATAFVAKFLKKKKPPLYDSALVPIPDYLISVSDVTRFLPIGDGCVRTKHGLYVPSEVILRFSGSPFDFLNAVTVRYGLVGRIVRVANADLILNAHPSVDRDWRMYCICVNSIHRHLTQLQNEPETHSPFTD